MEAIKNKLALKKNEYEMLLKYIYSRMTPLSPDNRNAEQLYEELKDAEIYEKDSLIPSDVIRIYSLVEVEELQTKKIIKFRIVLPAEANLNRQRLSVFAPLSIAMMGYRSGQQVCWNMPSGKKIFLIKSVNND